MRLGPGFSHAFFFTTIDISWGARNRMLNKIVFRKTRFFLLFSSARFFDIISSLFPQVLAKYFENLSLVVLQRVAFSKRYTLASFQ